MENIKRDLTALLDYLWHDESRHYQALPKRDHIFLVMKRLAKKIDYKSK